MLTIKEVKQENEGSGTLVFEARQDGERVAVCRLELKDKDLAVLKSADWDCSDNLDGVVRTALFAAMRRGYRFYRLDVKDERTAMALAALDIPPKAKLEVLFSGGCKGGCSQNCAECGG
jgi:hypothetical protein